MMKVEVESHINLSQWFLWLQVTTTYKLTHTKPFSSQEKSLFGFAALLTNDTPGVSFQAGDLVKNLLLSAFLERPIQYQDEIYQRLWRTNIQEKTAHIDRLLGGTLTLINTILPNSMLSRSFPD